LNRATGFARFARVMEVAMSHDIALADPVAHESANPNSRNNRFACEELKV
jgi:hypothetical protein